MALANGLLGKKTYVEALNLDTMFTPQVVVQGRTQCVANEEEALLSSIMSAQKFPSPNFQVSFLFSFRQILSPLGQTLKWATSSI